MKRCLTSSPGRSVLALLLVVFGSSVAAPPARAASDVHRPALAPGVKILTGAGLRAVEPIVSGGGPGASPNTPDLQLVFAPHAPETTDLQQGNFLVLPRTAVAPQGLLQRVVSIIRTQLQTLIATRLASLNEVLNSGSFAFDRQFAARCQQVNRNLYYNQSLGAGVGVKGSMCFAVHISLNGKLANGHLLTSGSFGVGIDTTATVAAQGSVNTSQQYESAPLVFTPITVYMAGVPLVITPRFSLLAGFNGFAQANLTVGARQRASVSVSFSCYDTLCTMTPSFHLSYPSRIGPAYGGNASLVAWVGPQLQLLLYGRAGPNFALKAYVEGVVNTAAHPAWTVYAGETVYAQLLLHAVVRDIATQPYTLYSRKTILATAAL